MRRNRLLGLVITVHSLQRCCLERKDGCSFQRPRVCRQTSRGESYAAPRSQRARRVSPCRRLHTGNRSLRRHPHAVYQRPDRPEDGRHNSGRYRRAEPPCLAKSGGAGQGCRHDLGQSCQGHHHPAEWRRCRRRPRGAQQSARRSQARKHSDRRRPRQPRLEDRDRGHRRRLLGATLTPSAEDLSRSSRLFTGPISKGSSAQG